MHLPAVQELMSDLVLSIHTDELQQVLHLHKSMKPHTKKQNTLMFQTTHVFLPVIFC